MSTIQYTSHPPASVRASVASYLASRGATWCDYASSGAKPKYRDTPAALVAKDGFAETIGTLAREHGFDFLVDHTAVDYPDRKPRFTVIAVLESHATHEVLVLKTRVEEDEPVPTLTGIYKSADWAERETYDMFGIPFEGHPDLTRIYMPEDFDGWPMRRDFPLEGHLRFRD